MPSAQTSWFALPSRWCEISRRVLGAGRRRIARSTTNRSWRSHGVRRFARCDEAPEGRVRAAVRCRDSAPRRRSRDVDEDDLAVVPFPKDAEVHVVVHLNVHDHDQVYDYESSETAYVAIESARP